MSHDVQDLLDLIKKLEERIIDLEKQSRTTNVVRDHTFGHFADRYYWEHG